MIMRLFPLLLVVALLAILCVGSIAGHKLHRKPGPQATPVRRVVEARQVRAENTYAGLFDMGSDEDPINWKVIRHYYPADKYRKEASK